jgi:hypothetical protein
MPDDVKEAWNKIIMWANNCNNGCINCPLRFGYYGEDENLCDMISDMEPEVIGETKK